MKSRRLKEAVAIENGMTMEEASKAVATIFEEIKFQLLKGNRVVIEGFGSFELRQTKPRRGYDLASKRIVEYPAQKSIRFKVSKVLSQKIKS